MSESTPIRELVVLTGLSGSGKGSALKAFEDLGYYSVDNLPIELLPPFAELIANSPAFRKAAIVVDIREGRALEDLPATLLRMRKTLPVTIVYLEAARSALLRRYSETRRPHPLGADESVESSLDAERELLDPVRNVADVVLETTNFNVHELRAYLQTRFGPDAGVAAGKSLLVSVNSFGYKNGVPLGADLVLDVRFLPNPHFIPEFRPLTGQDREVIDYVGGFPQTREFLDKTVDLLLFLLPHYVHEGKSYLTISFGCTGGQHRSVMIAEEVSRRLAAHDYRVKIAHRDMPR
ncbi:RNase adapter RapZ [Acidipila sp. EB88]|uniref:RNase adapter RapZ n=1 Tax=Acidipila sp. EB88 TaxID=2305226 RepID=UPI0026A06441